MMRGRPDGVGLPVEQNPEPAANEEFTATLNRDASVAGDGGWDPYEVWQTRVKAPSKGTVTKDPRRDRRR